MTTVPTLAIHFCHSHYPIKHTEAVCCGATASNLCLKELIEYASHNSMAAPASTLSRTVSRNEALQRNVLLSVKVYTKVWNTEIKKNAKTTSLYD